MWIVLLKLSPFETCALFVPSSPDSRHHDESESVEMPDPTAYYVQHWFGLKSSCPVGTMLLGQVVVDTVATPPDINRPATNSSCAVVVNTDEYQLQPTVLLSDIIRHGQHDTSKLPPFERYRILREECLQYLPAAPVIRVQWAGLKSASLKFCHEAAKYYLIPHEVDYVFGYTSEHPCTIIMVGLNNDDDDNYTGTSDNVGVVGGESVAVVYPRK